MSVIEQSVYVAVGAADLAAEKVRELPAVKSVRERATKFRETSVIDQAREIEPKVRKQAKELAGRGETVVNKLRTQAKDFRGQINDFPAEARKQVQEFPKTARKQVDEVRTRISKRLNGNGDEPAAKTAKKAPAKAAATATQSS